MAKDPDSPLQRYLVGYQARQAARHRLPIWIRFLMPLLGMSSVLLLTIVSVRLLWSVHHVLHPEVSFAAMSTVARGLILFPPFFGLLAPTLMLLNYCFWRVPPLRRIFEENSRGVPGASYDDSMSGLRKLAIGLAPPALVLALIGAVEPWAL